jgi:hypothetical protein
MNSIARNNTYKKIWALPEVGWPTTISAILHIGVFILAVMGLPQIANRSDIYLAPDEMIMDVSLFNASEVIEDDKPKTEGDDAPPPPVKPVYNNTNSVPDLARPEQPEIKDKTEEPVEKTETVAADPTLIKVPPKPRVKPKPPKPKPKQVEIKPIEPEKPVEPERNIKSLLKDLTPSDWENAQEQIESNEKNAESTTQIGNASVQMTNSDLVALNQGVQPCWNVNAGGRFAENLEVKLRVMVNPDRSVREVTILDQIRYSTDPHFRSAADAAKWALLNAQCSTLNLPPEKYETWKNFIYVFDPRQML